MQVKRAIQQQGGLWEVIAEVGRDKQEHTALHSVLVLADQMNVRSGAQCRSSLTQHLGKACRVIHTHTEMCSASRQALPYLALPIAVGCSIQHTAMLQPC